MDLKHRNSIFLVTIFCFIIFLSGLTILILGSVLISSLNYVSLIGDIEVDICIVLIVTGSITIILSFIGCFGAFSGSSCILYGFSILVAVTLTMELGGALAAFVYHDQIVDDVTSNMNASMTAYYNDTDVQNEWDDMQSTLVCCGTSGVGDWVKLKLPVPDSCCDNVVPGGCEISSATLHTQGCINAIYSALGDNAWIIGGVALGVAFVKIVGFGLSCCLATKLKRSEAK